VAIVTKYQKISQGESNGDGEQGWRRPAGRLTDTV